MHINTPLNPPVSSLVQGKEATTPNQSGLMAERKLFVVPVYCRESVHEYFSHPPRTKAKGLDILRSKVRGHLSAMGWKYWYAKKGDGEELRYRAPDGQDYYSLRMACQGCIQREVNSLPIQETVMKSESRGSCLLESEFKEDLTVSCSTTYGNQRRPLKRTRARCLNNSEKNKRRKTVQDQNKPKKRVRQGLALDPAYCTPRNILSWLISKDVILARTNVYYRKEFDCRAIARGKVTRDGIKCDCCNKVYGISSFQQHITGSSSGRAAAHMFLEDGSSLLDCEEQMLRGRITKERQLDIKRSAVTVESDDICWVCHNGGSLLLCDGCPSVFHLSCIGLDQLPEGNWFCPSCRCSVCGEKEFYYGDANDDIVHCHQCERGFHLGCLWGEGLSNKHKWFCSLVCENVHTSLHQLLGKSTQVGAGKLRCSVLKFSKDVNAFDMETMAEHHVKLNLALSIMHECFESIKEEHSNDLVEDILFCRKSALKRLDFRGYYTFLLEKEDELVSVATVRVFGGKVAEVPLVATRLQYRRQGMCHILMDFLEKTLKELGVERLLLASTPQVLEAWTTSFGFSEMPHSERNKFLNYTFLDFQGTTVCQKILTLPPRINIIGPRPPPPPAQELQ